MNTQKESCNIKYTRNRDCFSVSIDYKKYTIFADIASKNNYLASEWERNPITFVFLSVSDKEIHEKEPDNYKSYFCYIGADGDDNLFDLGAYCGSKENIIKQIEDGTFFFKYVEKHPTGFEKYRLQQYIEHLNEIYKTEPDQSEK